MYSTFGFSLDFNMIPTITGENLSLFNWSSIVFSLHIFLEIKEYSILYIMFNYPNIIYESNKPGEAEITLCEDTLANKVLGWNPKINLVDYIKNFKNGNKFYNTKQEQFKVS